jgi:glycosyltransferase involved in cell wall biosynthesis
MIYNAVGVTVVPSLEENLSNVIMESLACGTPVVAFNIGGNSDLITHKVNGYLAIPSDVKDLAQGIDWVLNNKEELNLSQNCINKVRKEFDYSIVAKKYTNLYKKILNQ